AKHGEVLYNFLMSKDLRLWAVKLAQGTTLGPLTTYEIVQRIQEGEFDGSEFIALYPSNQFFAISQQEPFFTEIMNFLEGKPSEQIRSKSIHEDTFRESDDTVTGAQNEAITSEDVKAQVEEYQRIVQA